MLQLLQCRQLENRTSRLEHFQSLARSYLYSKFSLIPYSQDAFPVLSRYGGISKIKVDPVFERFVLVGCSRGSVLCFDIMAAETKVGKIQSASCSGARATQDGHTHKIADVKWLPNETGVFITASADKTVRIWDTHAFRPVFKFKFKSIVESISLSGIPQGATRKLIATCQLANNEIVMCDMGSGSNTHYLRGHTRPVLCCEWSSISEYILYSGSADHTIAIWDVRKSGEHALLGRLDRENIKSRSLSDYTIAHNGPVKYLQFVHGGHYLVSSGSDGELLLWQLDCNGAKLHNYLNTRINFTPPIQDMVARSPGCVCVATGGVPVKNLEVFHTVGESGVHFGRFRLHDGHFQGNYTGHFTPIISMDFRAHSQQLLTASVDGVLLRWGSDRSMPSEEPLEDDVHANSDDDWNSINGL